MVNLKTITKTKHPKKYNEKIIKEIKILHWKILFHMKENSRREIEEQKYMRHT